MLGDAARVWRLIFSKACLKWMQWMALSKKIIPLNIISSTKPPPNSFSWWDDPTLWVHKTFFSQATPTDDSFYCFAQTGFFLHSTSSSEPGQAHVSAPSVTEGWSNSQNPTASAHQECDTNRSCHLPDKCRSLHSGFRQTVGDLPRKFSALGCHDWAQPKPPLCPITKGINEFLLLILPNHTSLQRPTALPWEFLTRLPELKADSLSYPTLKTHMQKPYSEVTSLFLSCFHCHFAALQHSTSSSSYQQPDDCVVRIYD